MTHLGPLELGFLELEDADPHVSLAIGVAAIVDGPAPSPQDLRIWIDRGLESHARLRQSVRRAPLDVSAPTWEDDPHFALAHHIRRTALPGPGGEQQLRELIATELTERLDRDHPLWRITIVEHLAHDRWALILRAHHTLIDGISGITLLEDFCDGPSTAHQHGTRPGNHWRTGYFDRLKAILELPVTVPLATAGTIRALAPVLYSAIAPTAESSLNGTIGQQRRYAVARAELPQVQEICTALGVTVNDVAVAAITAAYRRLLLLRGETPHPGELRVVIPVSTRAKDAKQILDNRISATVTELPIDVNDPGTRLALVHRRIRDHRTRGEAEAEKSVLTLARRLPAGIVASALRVVTHFPQRAIGTLATNVPGPRHRLTLGGREIIELWPCIPTAMRLRTTIAILSYRDQLIFGITADYDSTPDIDTISASIETEISVLLARARGRRPPRRLQLVSRN
ncbi:wax ester/triacylglycerol synthase family O-acyltransferase [Nocardia miyunensis]|uniref:wax ester/triacylglycerol synthase family O-acyltransferase n=1 Tax=Nocardia miyunensis TaxID=282684 RepID=UPI00082FC356|nr:wax ester/triacylglycerol synthase family O-acyltransferase [Nocardia miyunensis]